MRPKHGNEDAVERLVSGLVPRLRAFSAVGRAEHVTRAAQALGVPQPTLSRSVARLEADLGVVLLVRSGRGVRLSRAGRVLLGAVDTALEVLEAGVREVAGEVAADTGRVSLGFLHTLGSSAVPRLLHAFREEHPRVRVELVQRNADALLELLRTGAVDLCLTSPLPEEEGLATAALQQERLVLVVPRAAPLGARRRVRLAEVAGESFVGLERGYGLRATTDAWCRQAGFTPALAFEGEEIDTVRGLVAAGLGVALLPPDPRGPGPGVVEVEVVAPRPSRTVGLVWRAAGPTPDPPAVRAFRDLVLGTGAALLGAPTSA